MPRACGWPPPPSLLHRHVLIISFSLSHSISFVRQTVNQTVFDQLYYTVGWISVVSSVFSVRQAVIWNLVWRSAACYSQVVNTGVRSHLKAQKSCTACRESRWLLLWENNELQSQRRPIGIWAHTVFHGQYPAGLMSRCLARGARCPAASAVHNIGRA